MSYARYVNDEVTCFAADLYKDLPLSIMPAFICITGKCYTLMSKQAFHIYSILKCGVEAQAWPEKYRTSWSKVINYGGGWSFGRAHMHHFTSLEWEALILMLEEEERAKKQLRSELKQT